MSHIFVSYSHDDAAVANKLVNDLLDRKYTVWMDNLNLAGGAEWDNAIMQAIDDCSHFLLLWSANIEGSSYSIKEKDRALAGNKPIIPLMVSGDASRIWSDIKAIQYLDLRDYSSAFKQLTEQIPLPEGVLPPPDIRELLRQENITFNAAQRLFRSQFDYGKRDEDAVALLIERSEYGLQSFLVGKRSQKLQMPSAIQVFMNFSGNVDTDRFEDFLGYAREVHPELPTVLIRGAITSTARGLQYFLPNDKKVWDAAARLAWRAIGKVGTDSLPLHLYMNAPVALGAGFCAMEHFRREVYIYHTNFTPKTPKDRYFLVFQF